LKIIFVVHRVYHCKISPRYLQGPVITEIDSRDKGTPDDWIPRHPKLVRLTGRHPLNGEPMLHDLFDAGMITPNALHYVRNHGTVPKLQWETHKVSVEGLVTTPHEFTMDELASMPSISII
jgi:nitrate reductase (NAD(P)H)